MRPARIVSLPWPPSSSLCLRSLRARIVPLSSFLCMIRSPLIFGQPSWLVLATAPAAGSRTTTPANSVSLRTMSASLLAQAVGFSLVEGELARRRGRVGVAGRAPAADGRLLDRLGQRRLGAV